MKINTISIGDINGTSVSLPDKKIIKEAQRNKCMSAAFWVKINLVNIHMFLMKKKSH